MREVDFPPGGGGERERAGGGEGEGKGDGSGEGEGKGKEGGGGEACIGMSGGMKFGEGSGSQSRDLYSLC